MQDLRISVRLTKEQHEKLKILVIKRNTTINKFLLDYITQEIDESDETNKEDNND